MDDLAAYERRFRKAGLPLLIEDYSAREDVFTRAFGFMVLVALAELFGAIDLDWSLAANIAAVVGALGVVLVGLAILNRVRKRPYLSRPEDVGPPELVAFVIVPSLLPLIFGFQWRSALATLAGNTLLLGIIYIGLGYGVVSIVRWAAGRLLAQLVASIQLLTRALPLLLIFSLITFLTPEMWQVFGLISRGSLTAIGVLFILLGSAFIIVSIPRMVVRIEVEAGKGGPALSTRQRLNVGLVMFISQGLQVIVVSVAVAAFFVAFGLLATTPDIQATWVGEPANVIWSPELLGVHAKISEELLRVAGGIAAFSGLYYAIAVLTDATYRDEFLAELTDEMRDTFRAHTEYLNLRRSLN